MALLRYPGLLASVVVGVLLLSLVAAAYPLFLSRSDGDLLGARIADPTIERFGAGMFYGRTNIPFRARTRGGSTFVERIDRVLTRIADDGPYLDAPIRFMLGPTVRVTLPGGRDAASGPVQGALFVGTDAVDHVDITSGSPWGAVFPDLVTGPLEIEPGDLVELHGEGERSVSIRVGSVYDSLYDEPRSGYWSPWSEQIYRQCPDCSAPPQFIFVEPKELPDLSRALGYVDADYGWTIPVQKGPLTFDDARQIDDYAETILRQATRRGTDIGHVLECCGTTYGQGFFFGRRDIEFRSAMPLVLHEVERRAAGVEGPLRLLLIAGLGVAAAVVAAAAAFAVAGRRTEAALLHARGWGPGRFALRSTIEAALPTVFGAALGLGLGWWLVETFGPAAPACSCWASCRASRSSGPSRCMP